MKITRHKINILRKQDPVLADLIDSIGPIDNLELNTDHLKSAAKIIVDQQLSVKAARTIWNRLDDLVTDWSPGHVRKIDIETLRSAGLSGQKANYIKTLSSALHTDSFSFNELAKLDDVEAKNALIKIKGFGDWSAEMYLIFTLGRENVFSIKDAGLKRAVIKLYDIDEKHYLKKIDLISEKWQPYKSIASLYLWAWLD